MEEDRIENESLPSNNFSKPWSELAEVHTERNLIGLEPGESIAPLPERHNYEIEVVNSIFENSQYVSSEPDVELDSELENIVNEDDNEDEESNIGHMADEEFILEKFMKKRSPQKYENPANLVNETEVVFRNDSDSHNESESEVQFDDLKPNQWLIPISKIVVWSSGFKTEQKQKMQELVEKLGAEFWLDLTEEVTVLITIDNQSSKYVAARKDLNASIVTANWLKKSGEAGYFLNPKDYIFPEFYCFKFYLFNFDQNLKDTIEQHRGEIIEELDDNNLNSVYVIVDEFEIEGSLKALKSKYQWFSNKFIEKEITVVTNAWIETYLESDYETLEKCVIESHRISDLSEESKITPKSDDVIENSKSNKITTKVLHHFVQPLQSMNTTIDEKLAKLRNEPDFRKNMFLMDTNIYYYNMSTSDDSTLMSKLANVSGAFFYDNFVPDITTHLIVGNADKKLLKLAGSLDNSMPPYVVSKDWLIDSVLRGEKQDEKLYLPNIFSDLHRSTNDRQSLHLSRLSSVKYSKIFNKISFCIIQESYSEDEVEEITEKILSNSGAIVSEHIENSCARYTIQNDGYRLWKGLVFDKDEKTNKYIVSHRYLDEWLKIKKMVNLKKTSALNLLPFSYKPPVAEFKNICVAFTLYESKGNVIQVLQNWAELIGMKVEFTEENTTHLVVNNVMIDYINDRSIKVNTIKKTFKKRRPLVVNDKWFTDWLLSGKVQDETKYIINID